jgi:hypothetical protein
LYKYGFLTEKELLELDQKLLHKSNVLNGYRNLKITTI